MISIKDNKDKKEMFVISDRAQGGTLSKEGQIDIMVKQPIIIFTRNYTHSSEIIPTFYFEKIHRRLLFDDHFGVEEALNETVNGVGLTTKGTHYILLGGSEKSSKYPQYV